MNQPAPTTATGNSRRGFRPTPLAEVFSDSDYQFQIRFTRGEPAAFFEPTPRHAELVAERRRWLRESPDACAAWMPQCEPLLLETIQLAEFGQGFSCDANLTPKEKLLALGEFWEADFVLLRPDAEAIRLVGGCVCFPSSWKLSEKLSHPVEFIHSVVPGLNATIGPAIQTFLSRLKPGIAWQRFNWGLSRSPELNQHPDRNLPRLDASVGLDEVWFRLEDQALIALPDSGGILFGIRIESIPLAALRADAMIAARFGRALSTMPEEMARYKGLADARAKILQLFQR